MSNTEECYPGECSCETKRKPILKILVGLPRSGKTTYAERYKGSWAIISADQLRYLVYGQRFCAVGEDLVWAIRKVALKMLLEQGMDIVIDETNATKVRRKAIIDVVKKYDYTIEFVVINTSAEVCIQRAEAEGDKYIIPIIERMEAQFEPPNNSEIK